MSDSKKSDDGGPAYPHGYSAQANSTPGMSLRDWFAGQALNGAWAGGNNDSIQLAEGQTVDDAIFAHWLDVARCAYIAADAMLAARKAGA